MNITVPVLYRETQRWRDVWWVMVLVFGIAALNWYLTISHFGGFPAGDEPAPTGVVVLSFILFGVGLPLLFLFLHLTIEVMHDRVRVHYPPLTQRDIPIGDIAAAEPITYDSLREFGGWGIRGWRGRVAYNVSGHRAVELLLLDGRRVVLGSQQPEDLAAAIGRAMYSR
jgi:hypothetical protein